jgi:hypothetical protein
MTGLDRTNTDIDDPKPASALRARAYNQTSRGVSISETPMPLAPTSSRSIILTVCLALLIALGLLAHSATAAQPRRGVEVVRELRIPPGKYSAIVVSAFGGGDKPASWAAYLTTPTQRDEAAFPMIARGGESLIVPFAKPLEVDGRPGWTIRVSPDATTYLVSVWGIGENGPVQFDRVR